MGNYLTIEELESYSLGVSTDLNNTVLEQQILIAEQLVNSYILRPHGLQVQTVYNEKHPWNSRTNRVYPYVKPISAVNSFIIRTASNTTTDISVSTLFINNDEGFIEAPEITGITSVSSILLAHSNLSTPMVEITYLAGYATIPSDIKFATALQVADLLADRNWAAQGLAGIKSGKLGAQSLERNTNLDGVCQKAKILLNKYRIISIR